MIFPLRGVNYPTCAAFLKLGACLTCLATQAVLAQSESGSGDDQTSFSQAWLDSKARELARQQFQPAVLDADNPLQALDYDQYRRIVFDPDQAIWRDTGLPFQLQMFHPGFLSTTPVTVHLVAEGTAKPLPFSTELFDYHASLPAIDPADVGGFAGFRIHYPINTPERFEEFLVFLGASYFRAVGREQFYGLSARGLAVNTVGPGGEEFPRFSEFWIERPDLQDTQIVVHALLDSPSLTGSYRFLVTPGESTRIDVDATLFPRQDLPRMGIAPLTSMFLFDATNRSRFDDYRSAVHDSDGLQFLRANGEIVWRPLTNPGRLQVSAFADTRPVGFGLLQRHSEFAHFNDGEARYDKRTSLWIEPLDDWGMGHLELVEIPTGEETSDNIVAYWQPAGGLEAGGEYHFRYRMVWGYDSPVSPAQGRIVETAAGAVDKSPERVFVIDYSNGDRIPGVTSDPATVTINASTSAGVITDISGTLLEPTGRYRVYIKLDPDGAELAELRVTLEAGGQPWGETWLYRWTQ
ncbi:MAG: glucan biosynthesis protein [Gammaproteobacteria bacterium]|nr:glucan biosynthesis protein [Pseudomonadales bacterium]